VHSSFLGWDLENASGCGELCRPPPPSSRRNRGRYEAFLDKLILALGTSGVNAEHGNKGVGPIGAEPDAASPDVKVGSLVPEEAGDGICTAAEFGSRLWPQLNIGLPNGLELPALDRQARVPARRGGHDFYSMTSEMAGKCAFPPCGGSRVGTSEWLGAKVKPTGDEGVQDLDNQRDDAHDDRRGDPRTSSPLALLVDRAHLEFDSRP
jgi:hypothetical protein